MYVLKRLLILVLLSSPGILCAAKTYFRCPIPYVHMKPEMFSISNNHHASFVLIDTNSYSKWTVTISTTSTVIDNNSIAYFLRANQIQDYAYKILGEYVCIYANPFWGESAHFTARGK